MTLVAQVANSRLDTRERVAKNRLVVVIVRVLFEYRHLQRQRAVAALGETHPQRFDRVHPVRVKTAAVQNNHRGARLIGLGIDTHEFPTAGLQPFDLAIQDDVLDFTGHARLAREVRLDRRDQAGER